MKNTTIRMFMVCLGIALCALGSQAGEIITRPWLQNVYTNRFTVMCETRGEMKGLSVQVSSPSSREENFDSYPMVCTNGLKEGTFVYKAAVEGPTALPDGATIPYCLATNGVAIAGTEGSVKLWADGDAAFTCAIWGDNQEGVHEYDWGFDDTTERYRCVREMFRHMSAQKPDFGFTTGDISSFADYDNEIEPGDLRAADDLFCKGETPYHLIWGNHDCVGTFFGEVYTNAAQRYFSPAATEEDGWFHVYRNDVLFIGVHWTWGREDQEERYERILKEVAELLETPRAKAAKFRILMQHAPVFLELYNVLPGIEWFDDSRTHDVAVKGGVDLIFSGHTHAYERIERDGMIQITNGGMGYLDHGERCYKNFGTDTKVGGHQNTPYLWARQNGGGALGDRPLPASDLSLGPAMPVRMGCFASYGMLKVEGDTLTYTAHAFDANGDYIGVADTFEIESKTSRTGKTSGTSETIAPFTPTALTAPVNNATWKEFKTAQGETWEIPAGQKGVDPVVNVSKTEIARFCAALNAGRSGIAPYRLPTVKELTEIFGGDLKREVSEWTSDVDPNTGWCRILGGNRKAVDGTWCRAYDKPAIATADCHANYLGFRVIDAADPIPEVTVMDRALAKLAEIENPAEVYLWSALKGKLVDISDEWTKPTPLDKKTYGAPVIFTGKGPLVYRVRREVSFDGGLAAPNATALNIAHVLDLGPVSKPVTIKGEFRGGVSTNEWTFALRCDELTFNNVLYRGQALNVVTDSRALRLAGTNDFSGAVMTVCCDRKLPDPFKDCVTNLVTDSAATLKLRALHFSNRGVVEEMLVDKPAGLTVGENVTLVTAENVLFGIDGSTLTVNGALDAAGIDIEGHLMGILPQEATLGGSGEVTTTHFGMCDVSTLYVDVTNTIVRSSIPYRTYTACTNGCNVVYRAPRQPNYADATGNDWLYNHAIAGKACPDEAVETGVDLFYVYPTVAGGEQIVIDGFRGIDDETMRSSEPSFSTAVGAFVLSARCLADMTHVYAPFYRQATLATAYDISTNALGEVKATANADYLKFLYEGPAYADVTNALDVYFTKWNKGRPFVLAAHSQGSAILRLLMKNYFTRPENRDKAKRLVCSYQIGFGVSEAEMEDVTAATGITFAEKADDTNVIVSYNTMGEGSSGNSTLLSSDTIAINPLTWTRGTELAEKNLNLGALTNDITAADVIVPGLYGAQIADTGFNRGQVVVCKELNDQVLPPSIFGTGSLHPQDYSAYWENVRANVYDRGGNLAGLCKLCTTNFPAHLCVSNATINLIGKSAFDVDPVAGTVWIPTNGLESAIVTLVAEKGYRIMVDGTEYPFVPGTVTSSELQADGEFLIDSDFLSLLTVEWIQRKPDYADKTGKDWLFHHDIEAKRYAGEPAADPGVDLFFLYPTSVYISDDHVVDGVCDIDDPVLRGPNGATNSWVESAEVFGDFTHVYAPYYRQTPSDVEIGIGSQPNANDNMRKYWYKRAPYEDVTNALTHYFTVINPNGERPFIFAGHSHGSGMLSLVMEHFFAENGRKAWLKNMVACYAIGWGVSKDWEAKLNDDLDMYVATNATDAGVYVFWNTYGPNTNATECILYPDPAKSAACVNPLLWTRVATNATAELNLGGWTTDDPPRVLPHLYDASNHVANGTLICTSKDMESQYLPPLRMFGEHSLHGWDYKLYWENLRANAYQRIETATGSKPCCGTPTDYAKSENWLSRPETADKSLDVFYLYPTCVPTTCPTLVSEIDDDMKANAQEEYERGPSTFESYANVYAPYYRQGSVLMIVADTSAAGSERFCSTHVMKTDIFAALDWYFANRNPGAARPFILASHSQGSANMKNVLAEYFVGEKAAYIQNLVAAYILGWKILPDWCETIELPFATGAADTRVVLTWNAEGPGETGDNFLTDDPTQLAINPINWSRDTLDAPKADNLGSVITNAQGVLYHTGKPGVTGARLQTNRPGAVIMDAPETIPVGFTPGFGTKSYHFEDWGFFYDNIGANGFTRYANFVDLKPVSTNDIPTVADTTWKIEMSSDGKIWKEAVKSPIDGTYYVDGADETRIARVTYTINPEKAAANFVFQESGTTTASFPLSYVEKEGQWVQPQPVEDILAATKVIYNQRKPDYTQAKDWILNHYLKPDEARDLAGEPSQDSGVDLVYIYGTVAMTNAETTVDGFADIEDPQMRGDEATHTGGVWGMIPGSVKAFSDYTRVYMPFYRQMTLCGATNVMAKVGMEGANSAFAKALQEGVAYEDVAAALDAYFEKWNEGRPFILAGCSQGAAMLRNMVQYYFTQNPDKLDQLVACYGIAFGVTKEWAEMIENDTDGKIHFATNATERGVYISWNTVGPDSTAIPNGLVPPDAISINPLTWTTEATPADVDKNYGSLTNAATGAIVAHLYDATVDTVKGVVVSTNLPPSDYIKGLVWFGDKSLHTWEMPAWWENIRDNAYARIETATGKRPRCGTPNDYSKDENWMVKPETADKPVDVFFLYPTTDTGKTPNLIAEIDDAMKATAWDAYQQDTMGFWSYANMYAPYYRQASFLGLQAQAGVGGLKNFCSTHVVKTDVFAALDYYFTNLNANAARPYILAGHSQGSCNIKLIFEEYMKDHPTYKKKLVAAYAMGFAVEKSWCEKAGVDFAEGESDTGKILTWNCEGPDAVHGPVNFLTEPDDGQAINPLNWKTDDTYAGIGLNLGSVVTNAAGEYVWGKGNADAQLSPKAGSAYGFRPGALVVTNTTAAYSPEVLGYQSYHGNDGAFFQRNVGNNGFTRYAAFAGLKPVEAAGIPTVADATWQVTVNGQEAAKSPTDGRYFVPEDADPSTVKLVYTLDPEKAAEGYHFLNGETTTSFAMAYSGGVWVSTASKTEIEAATKVGTPEMKLGVVAQRYPWDGTVDIGYRTAFWPASGRTGRIAVTVGGTSVTNLDYVIFGSGEGVTNVDLRAVLPETRAPATFQVVEP